MRAAGTWVWACRRDMGCDSSWRCSKTGGGDGRKTEHPKRQLVRVKGVTAAVSLLNGRSTGAFSVSAPGVSFQPPPFLPGVRVVFHCVLDTVWEDGRPELGRVLLQGEPSSAAWEEVSLLLLPRWPRACQASLTSPESPPRRCSCREPSLCPGRTWGTLVSLPPELHAGQRGEHCRACWGCRRSLVVSGTGGDLSAGIRSRKRDYLN